MGLLQCPRMSRTLYLIDGHAQIYRAYYAPFRPLTAPSGEPTRATYVFCQMLFNLARDRRPDYLAIALDTSDETVFRCDIFPEYKAHRDPPPEDMAPQIDRIVSIVETSGIPILRLAGFEADDLMATVAEQLKDQDVDVYLVSKDKDLEQLLSDRTCMYDPGKSEVIDPDKLRDAKGYTPAQAVEIQTLTGDSVDNIPGVPGIGPKTAARLIQKYGTAAAVIDHANELTPKQKQNVLAFADKLDMTRQLVTLKRDCPIEVDLESMAFAGFPVDKLEPIFRELGFNRLMDLLHEIGTGPHPPKTAAATATSAPQGEADYRLIDSPEALKAFAAELGRRKSFAFDTETTGLNPVASDLVGLSFSWEAGTAYYIPVRAAIGPVLPLNLVVESVKEIFENPNVAKCGQNLKYDVVVLKCQGIDVAGVDFDSMIASFLLDPMRRSHGINALAQEFFDHRMIAITELIGKGKNQITLDQVDSHQVCEYAAEDADYAWQLCQMLAPQIKASTFAELFRKTELPLIEVLAQMEYNGVALDTEILARLSKEFSRRLDQLTEEIHAAAEHEFNIDSTKQLAAVLFDEQGLRVVRKTKTGRSTDADTLTTLAFETDSPIPTLVLEYRELSKLRSTYIDALPRMICAKTGRVHAGFNPIGTVTGRLSSSDPNLQNIPIRTATGREIRKAFVPGKPDDVLLSADYSQIELRILAHFSRDATMQEAFRADQDIHRFVASQVFGVPPEDIDPDQRSRAKAVNFGIIYGQTPFGLARTTGMPVGQAKAFIDTYFMRYPGIRLFIDKCIDDAKSKGYAQTILGRRRQIPELRSRNRQQRSLGERLAVNTVVQGSAAELIKVAMINLHRRIRDEHLPLSMLIQVHDELVFEVPEKHVEQMADIIRHEMSHAMPLDVPIGVDIGWGRNWLECK